MATYRVKQSTINAVQHPGPEKLVVVGRKGEQTAHVGDFIVFYGERPEDREVVTNKEFFERYELDSADDASQTHVDQSAPVASVDKNNALAYDSAATSAQKAADKSEENFPGQGTPEDQAPLDQNGATEHLHEDSGIDREAPEGEIASQDVIGEQQ